MTAELLQYGIDLPRVAAYVAACLVSFTIAPMVIQWFSSSVFYKTLASDKISPAEVKAILAALAHDLDLAFGKRIGRLERCLYIYAIMVWQPGILSTWIILKAFFGWIEKTNLAAALPEQKRTHAVLYSSYIYGNGLSLLAGIILGHLGLVLAQWFKLYVFPAYIP